MIRLNEDDGFSTASDDVVLLLLVVAISLLRSSVTTDFRASRSAFFSFSRLLMSFAMAKLCHAGECLIM